MMPLLFVRVGENAVIKKSALDGELKKHMDNLGFLPGQVVTPVAKNAGNIIIKIGDSRLAVSEEIATKIFVN